MPLNSNLSHWVCLLAGLLLAVTGLLLRDIASDRTSPLTSPPGSQARAPRYVGIARRMIFVSIGLAAMAYSIMRMMD